MRQSVSELGLAFGVLPTFDVCLLLKALALKADLNVIHHFLYLSNVVFRPLKRDIFQWNVQLEQVMLVESK